MDSKCGSFSLSLNLSPSYSYIAVKDHAKSVCVDPRAHKFGNCQGQGMGCNGLLDVGLLGSVTDGDPNARLQKALRDSACFALNRAELGPRLPIVAGTLQKAGLIAFLGGCGVAGVSGRWRARLAT